MKQNATEQSTGFHLLLVEDSPEQAMVVRAFLRHRSDFLLTVVHDGATALQTLSEAPFNLIILDRGLPDMTGEEVASSIQRLCTEQQRAPIPVVAITGFSRDEDLSPLRAVGCQAVLTKPIRRMELIKVLDSILGSKSPDHSAPDKISSPENMGKNRVFDEMEYPILDQEQIDRLQQELGVHLVGLVDDFLVKIKTDVDVFADQRAPLSQLLTTAHRLKGACGYLGLRRFHALLLQFESQGENRDQGAAQQLLPRIAQEATVAEEALKAWRARQ